MLKAEQEIDFPTCRKKEKKGVGEENVELFLLCIWMKIAIQKKKKYEQDLSILRLSLQLASALHETEVQDLLSLSQTRT